MSHSKNHSPHLLDPVDLGPYHLPNRVVMAPLTRMRAGDGNIPRDLNAEYYRQRSDAGLIISEATPVSPYGYGYADTPGIHTPQQAAGWRKVVDAVHAKGGRIFLQLWHVGRMSHPDLQPDGAQPVAPSALASTGQAVTREGPKPHAMPRALETAEVSGIVGEFERGARLAVSAGFDGVEIHGANGYLLEQFLSDGANKRSDAYGGSLANRARFALDVTEAVVGVWGADRVGYRLSPASQVGGIEIADRWGTYAYLVERLDQFGLAYLHFVEPRVNGSASVEQPDDELQSARFRPLISAATRLISAGGHDRASGEAAIASGGADLIAYGRHFIANPDLVERFRLDAPLNPYDRSTFYGGDVQGYTDYPFLEPAVAAHPLQG